MTATDGSSLMTLAFLGDKYNRLAGAFRFLESVVLEYEKMLGTDVSSSLLSMWRLAGQLYAASAK